MVPKDASFLSFLAFLLVTQGVYSQNQPLFPQPGTGVLAGSNQPPVFPQPNPQPPVVPQPSGNTQPPVFPQPSGNPQPPVFPQPSGNPQPPVFPQPNPQPPVFPQPSGNPQPPVFPQPSGNPQPPVFPQPSGNPQPPVFPQRSGNPQPPVFPQPSGNPQPPVFPQPNPQPPVFPQPSGNPQPPVFPQPSGNPQPPVFPQPNPQPPVFPQPSGNPQPPVFPQPSGNPQPPAPTSGNQQYVTTPKCPEGNDKVYPAPDGSFFKLQCSTHGWFGTLVKGTANTYQECIDTCSATDGCLAINWDSDNGALSQSKTCALMKSDKVGDTFCANHDYAYAVPPPTIPQTAELVPQCTTECPGADHRQYTSRNGETFKMNCGKRHGADYLTTLDRGSLKECMDACSELVPCHSVDYHARSKKCYLSNHPGEPIIDAPGFNSAYSIGCAGACEDKCCGDKNA